MPPLRHDIDAAMLTLLRLMPRYCYAIESCRHAARCHAAAGPPLPPRCYAFPPLRAIFSDAMPQAWRFSPAVAAATTHATRRRHYAADMSLIFAITPPTFSMLLPFALFTLLDMLR